MSIKLITFDLDGTLLDISERYYRSIKDSLEEFGLNCPQKEVIIDLKRKGFTGMRILEEITNEDREKLELLEKKRIERLNSESYYELDTLLPNVKEILEEIRNRNIKIAILTSRPSYDLTKKQLQKIGIADFIDFIVSERGEETGKLKLDMGLKICERFAIDPSECCMIGDTGYEIDAGNKMGSVTIGVTYGLSNKQVLSEKNPSYIISDINEIFNVLNDP